MLDANPLLAIPEETHLPYTTFVDMGDGEEDLEQFISLITKNYLWREFHIDTERFCREIRALKPFSVSNGLRLFYSSYAYHFRKPRWGDKTPPYCNCME